MQILVDADSCPRQVREVILRSSKRTKIPVIFAANRPIPGIEETLMELCTLEEGSADNRIVELARIGDLVITRDIPLAERLVDMGICVLNDRGRVYTLDNIRYCRCLRDFSVGIAESGMGMDRIEQKKKKELKAFADSFDRELTRIRG
jgi:uncharacterized protein YaiI (UPF0178 family)